MADKNMFLKNYYFYGKHADMVKALTDKVEEESGAKIFSSAVELFIYSAMVGLFYNHRSKPDSDKNKHTNILAEQFNGKNREIKIVFKFVTLLGNQDKYDEITRLNKTFRNPETDENYKAFEEYVLGGLEEIYDKLMIKSNTNYQDYLTSLNKLLNEFNPIETDDTIGPSTEDFF